MKGINGYTEQFQDWSDKDTTCLNHHIAQTAACAWQAIADLPLAAHPGLFDYTVYALWQTSVLLCDGARAWPQVLSVGESRRTTSNPDLCPARLSGAGARAVGPTTDSAHARRRAVRHWLRITDAPCRQITRSDGVGQLASGDRCDRYHGCQSTRGQHVGTRRERPAVASPIRRGGISCARR